MMDQVLRRRESAAGANWKQVVLPDTDDGRGLVSLLQ